jgi:anti-sigma factor RsiW
MSLCHRDDVGRYLDDQLTATEKPAFFCHLENCEHCREVLEEISGSD